MAEKQDAIRLLRKEIVDTDFDLSNLIGKVISVTSEYSTVNELSLQTLIKDYDSSTKRSLNTLLEDSVPKESYTLEKDRAYRYKQYEDLLEKIPVIEQAMEILSTEIATSETATEVPVIITKPLELPEGVNDERIAIIQSRISSIIEKFKIEDIITQFAWDLPVYGDIFCEIENYGSFLKKQGFMESENQSDKDISELNSSIELKLDENGDILQVIDVKEELNSLSEYSTDILSESLYFESDDSQDDYTPLAHLKPTVLNPKRVIIVRKYTAILGYIVIEIEGTEGVGGMFSNLGGVGEKGDDGTAKIDQLATTILNQLFKGKSATVKKVLEDNPEFVSFVGVLLKSYKKIDSIKARFVHLSSMVHKNMPNSKYFPYGKSSLESVLEWGKYIVVGLRSTMLYRFTRAPDLRIFKVDIGADRDAMAYIQKVKQKIQQRKYALDPNADIDTLSSQITMFDDLWVPTRSGQEFFTIENIQQGDLNTRLDDLKYLSDQMINGFGGIPPTYLNSDRAIDDRLSLAQQNARFAKTIIKYQRQISRAIDELIKKIYIMAYGSDPLLSKFKIKLIPPMSLFVERLSESFNNIQSIVSTLRDLKVPERYIFDFLSAFFDTDKIQKYLVLEKLNKIESASQKARAGENEEGGMEF